MALKNFSDGEILTADDVDEYLVNVRFVRKAADETVTSSTTFQDDNVLVLPVDANKTYELTLFLRYDAATAADLKIQLVLPSGAAFTGQMTRLSLPAASLDDVSVILMGQASIIQLGGLGAGTFVSGLLIGNILMSSTAGNCQLQWAQDTSNATATGVRVGSYMKLTRVD